MTKQKIKLEQKLQIKLGSTNSEHLQSETSTSRETPSPEPDSEEIITDFLEEWVNPACVGSDDVFKGDYLGLTGAVEPSLLISMVSHFNPHLNLSVQRPESILSMISHCVLRPSPGSSLMTKEEFSKLLTKYLRKRDDLKA